MTISRRQLYGLLPEHYRERDSSGALRQYLDVLTDELAVLSDGVDQLYDDLFVETAAPWVLPYLAELIGLRGLPGASIAGLTSRAEVANTIGYRRRKGTTAVLEQLAHDTTGWPARAVEYFELLAAVQHMNHVRRHVQVTPDLRRPSRLQFAGAPFERGDTAAFVHLPDMRRIAPRAGRYNVPNVGIHLWRLSPYPLTHSSARPAEPGEEHRFLLDALGGPVQLFSLPEPESEIADAAEPVHVPSPLTRLRLHEGLQSYYGAGRSVVVEGVGIDAIEVADLRDASGGWAHTPPPPGIVRVDPVLGRLAFGDARPSPPVVSYHYGFSADLGGGEYRRVDTFATVDGPVQPVGQTGAVHTTVSSALDAIAATGGTVEILDNARYTETPAITTTGPAIEVRAAEKRRPLLELDDELVVTLDGNAEVSLNGLVITGGQLRVTGTGLLELRHCTLVPGIGVRPDGEPAVPGAASLIVDSPGVSVRLERCILGGVRAHIDADVTCVDTVLDAGEDGVAFASAPDGSGPGGTMSLDACTVLGKVHARILARASNSILLGSVAAGDEGRWPGPVLVDRRQQGCVRFSYIPAGSRTPRRYRCVAAEDSAALRPVFTSTRYGRPGYIQLDRRTPPEVWRGADDESELGALHHLNQPLREAYLERRIQDYLRFGLEVGIFFAT